MPSWDIGSCCRSSLTAVCRSPTKRSSTLYFACRVLRYPHGSVLSSLSPPFLIESNGRPQKHSIQVCGEKTPGLAASAGENITVHLALSRPHQQRARLDF